MTFPTFAEFSRELHAGREPFPWQVRLAEVVTTGGWPTEIGVPTGLGKTSCIDIAVWALAMDAQNPPTDRVLPTRTWYVVNRRLLVDAAHDHATRLQEALQRSSAVGGALDAVAEALRERSGFSGAASSSGLAVSRLRGGTEIGARPPHPAQVSLILSTVPMFASSWLFRGYASSRSMSPVDAAHAGIDSLVLLDEAHLARPLLDLAPKLYLCDIGDPGTVFGAPSRSRPLVVSMSATGSVVDPFELDEADRRNEVVATRLDAPKSLEVRQVEKPEKKLAKPIAEAVVDLLEETETPPSICVFVNQPGRAREVLAELTRPRTFKAMGSPEVVVLTGRMRRAEADAARRRVLDPTAGVQSGRARPARDRSLIVIATQTLEVGADLDFDLMVTESCGARALIQRLGRLNRLGALATAKAILVHPTKDKTRAVYGDEPAAVVQRLVALVEAYGTIDVSPRKVSEVVGKPLDQPPRAGEILPAHLWEYAKTTTPPPGEAPVELFFDGFDDRSPRLSVCWRRHIPEDGARLVPSVHVDESVEVPLWEFRQEFSGDEHGSVAILSEDRVTVEHVQADAVRPGAVVVLSCESGLYDQFGWGAPLGIAVNDVSIDRWPGLLLDDAFLSHWLSEVPAEIAELRTALLDETGEVDPGDFVEPALGALRLCEPTHSHEQWAVLIDRLTTEVAPLSTSFLLVAEESIRQRESDVVAADSLDDLCANATSAGLTDHLESVGAIARGIASSLGLPPVLVEACAEAGRFHDLGKADERFQRWLAPSGEPEIPVAKSKVPRWRWRQMRLTSGWPSGGRHEELSGRLLRAWLDEIDEDPPWDVELVLHLVLSHHGYGRPLLNPLEDDPTATTVAWNIDGTEVIVPSTLTDTDWSQPARFRRCCERYGYWGVALLESIVRQADHIASGVVVA